VNRPLTRFRIHSRFLVLWAPLLQKRAMLSIALKQKALSKKDRHVRDVTGICPHNAECDGNIVGRRHRYRHSCCPCSLCDRPYAEGQCDSAQLSGDWPPSVFLRAYGRVFPPIFLRHGPGRDAVQPGTALLGLSRRQECRQHRGVRINEGSSASRHATFRRLSLSHPR